MTCAASSDAESSRVFSRMCRSALVASPTVFSKRTWVCPMLTGVCLKLTCVCLKLAPVCPNTVVGATHTDMGAFNTHVGVSNTNEGVSETGVTWAASSDAESPWLLLHMCLNLACVSNTRTGASNTDGCVSNIVGCRV